MCDAGDIAATFEISSLHTRLPTITIYELTPGGTGLADVLLEHHADLLRMAAQRVRECPCEHGCPSCVGPSLAEKGGRDLKRDVAQLIAALTQALD